MSRRLLLALLEEYSTKRYPIEYNIYMSNHVSHILICLHKMHFDDKALTNFAKMYVHRNFDTKTQNQYQDSNKYADDECALTRNDALKRGLESCVSRFYDPEFTRKHPQSFMKKVPYYDIYAYYTHVFFSQCNGRLYDFINNEAIKCLFTNVAVCAFHPIIQIGYGSSVDAIRTVIEGVAYLHYGHFKHPYIYDRVFFNTQANTFMFREVLEDKTGDAQSLIPLYASDWYNMSSATQDRSTDNGLELRSGTTVNKDIYRAMSMNNNGDLVTSHDDNEISKLKTVELNRRMRIKIDEKWLNTFSSIGEALLKAKKMRYVMIIGSQKDHVQQRALSAFQSRMIALSDSKSETICRLLSTIQFPVDLDMGSSMTDIRLVTEFLLEASLIVYFLCQHDNDFFLLHGVTSAYAVMRLMKHIQDPQTGLQIIHSHLFGLLSAHVTQGSPGLNVQKLSELKQIKTYDTDCLKHLDDLWREKVMKHIDELQLDERFDEHSVKVAQVCYDMYNRKKDKILARTQNREDNMEGNDLGIGLVPLEWCYECAINSLNNSLCFVRYSSNPLEEDEVVRMRK